MKKKWEDQRNKNYSKEPHSKSGVENYKRETKNSLKEFNSTFGQEEKRISKLEDRTNEIIKLKEQKEKRIRKLNRV